MGYHPKNGYIYIYLYLGVPEGKKRASEILYKGKMANGFPNLGKEIHIQIHEAQRMLRKRSLKKSIL